MVSGIAAEILSQTAVWYSTGFPPVPIRWVILRDPTGRFATQALLCPNLSADPSQIVSWFVLRWQLEVTFHEVRAHLGMETQRRWSQRAITRTTPALLGLFSLVTLMAHPEMSQCFCLISPQTAWYPKLPPDLQRCSGSGSSPPVDIGTFSDIPLCI